MANDREARQLIVQIVNELYSDGHLTSTGGNVSHRSEDGKTLWITPSGLFKGVGALSCYHPEYRLARAGRKDVS